MPWNPADLTATNQNVTWPSEVTSPAGNTEPSPRGCPLTATRVYTHTHTHPPRVKCNIDNSLNAMQKHAYDVLKSRADSLGRTICGCESLNTFKRI